MDYLDIQGPCALKGTVKVSSSKNASLPILAATLLYPGKCRFTNLPELSDINFFIQILQSLGATCEEGTVDASSIESYQADYDLVRKMRASVLVLGPLLSRFKQARVSLPGGCAIGSRPVDIHLSGMEKLGANIKIEAGYIEASCEKLVGAKIVLPFPSVGATENLMMAAAYAEGETIIDNAAREPEIEDLANFMTKLGFSVEGAGTSTIVIKGRSVEEMSSIEVTHEIIGDRIEAATYIIGALITNSTARVEGFKSVHLDIVLDTLKSMGAQLLIEEDAVEVRPSGQLSGTRVETAPYPGFPTDAQAQLMALMGVCKGDSQISEHIFENRFMHVPELARMGYDIKVDGRVAYIKGESSLKAAPVMCTDLRASAALVLAAMAAEGTSQINRIYHLDRGYAKLADKLKSLNVNIERVKQ
ncbi:MAG: UDP-N-acetylglucosamine 1-carboxyvinyltransferase [Halobacteriovoraceae bacterium]|nr:UDP-N-acetylglucosamine 1-carboxyvinyltransferase [Halobacteriovoraceae bacterium]|tara:strand:+ start:60014 stop:61267 length:1254 start_codon:yes stop_codon:yes gene_type:complete